MNISYCLVPQDSDGQLHGYVPIFGKKRIRKLSELDYFDSDVSF